MTLRSAATVVCGYHGFTYDAQGTCVAVPGQSRIPLHHRRHPHPHPRRPRPHPPPHHPRRTPARRPHRRGLRRPPDAGHGRRRSRHGPGLAHRGPRHQTRRADPPPRPLRHRRRHPPRRRDPPGRRSPLPVPRGLTPHHGLRGESEP
ncbi:Rieske 2Fe-2S domain-containing protein [Actinocorallia herbida]|uniref:Rieske 2Fe-2S domain-containing protein n=1 Tax=Actinocorallia herbida TaxID=58109 RepID=UPI001B8714A7